MDSIFLSFSFSRPEDRFIVSEFEDLFRSFGIRTITGRNLGGNELTDEIRSLIGQSDALVALASQREKLASGGWVTHPWITDEFGHAKAIGKNAIVIVEDEVDLGGAFAGCERISFDRNSLEPALLKLAKTLGIWKDKAGSRLKIRLMPDELLDTLQSPKYQYQFISPRGDALGWNVADPVSEPGGIYLHVLGARDDYLIEVEVSSNNGVRRSRATSQTMPVIVE